MPAERAIFCLKKRHEGLGTLDPAGSKAPFFWPRFCSLSQRRPFLRRAIKGRGEQ
jgi:hypothetical protein